MNKIKHHNLFAFSLLILFFTNLIYSQPLIIEVKSADDVIGNYLTAIGGKSKLKEIFSYRITGIANFFGYKVNYDEFADSNRYYLNTGNDTINILKLAINDTIRWVLTEKEGKDTVTDFSGEHHANWNKYLIQYNFFYFFLNYQKYGLNLKLDSMKNTNDSTLYEITFSKSDTVKCIAAFDKNNFFLKKFTVKTIYEIIFGSSQLSYEFDDYKVVNNTGIIMPFTIVRNEMIPVEITNYSFNSKIGQKFFQKPILKK